MNSGLCTVSLSPIRRLGSGGGGRLLRRNLADSEPGGIRGQVASHGCLRALRRLSTIQLNTNDKYAHAILKIIRVSTVSSQIGRCTAAVASGHYARKVSGIQCACGVEPAVQADGSGQAQDRGRGMEWAVECGRWRRSEVVGGLRAP